MRIKILRLSVIPGCDGAQVGDVVECLDSIGAQIVGLGRAVEWHGLAPKREVATAPEAIQVREPSVETRDPEFVTVKRKK